MSEHNYGNPVYWRETHRQPRFLVFDGRVVVVLILCVMHIRPWTIAIAMTALAIQFYFQRKGVSMDSILRFIRAKFVGRRRTARGHDAERGMVDFGFETEADVEAVRKMISIEKNRILSARKKAASRVKSKTSLG